MVQQLTHDSAREPERLAINPPPPREAAVPGADHPNESLEDRYRDRGGRASVPVQVRREEESRGV